jgi:cob(I)alamin adenosyltransferase
MKIQTNKQKTTDDRHGYIQIYTGNGKGKTTAALGLAVRAAGSGLRTYIGQFLKGQKYAELESLKALAEHITIEQFGKDTFIYRDKVTAEDIAMAREGLQRCQQAMVGGNFDIIVMDEICMAMHLGILSVDEVLTVIAQKPQQVELVLTGRKAPQRLIQEADLVTEMVEVKHYYQKGVGARAGIEE